MVEYLQSSVGYIHYLALSTSRYKKDLFRNIKGKIILRV